VLGKDALSQFLVTIVFYLINDRILEIDPAAMLLPMEEDRFSALSLDYVIELGKEMFAEDAFAQRNFPERVKRLCYLMHLKQPRINAVSFYDQTGSGQAKDVLFASKNIHAQVMDMLHTQQVLGQLDTNKVDQAVWNRMAA
jgi:hypothetical protein